MSVPKSNETEFASRYIWLSHGQMVLSADFIARALRSFHLVDLVKPRAAETNIKDRPKELLDISWAGLSCAKLARCCPGSYLGKTIWIITGILQQP